MFYLNRRVFRLWRSKAFEWTGVGDNKLGNFFRANKKGSSCKAIKNVYILKKNNNKKKKKVHLTCLMGRPSHTYIR